MPPVEQRAPGLLSGRKPLASFLGSYHPPSAGGKATPHPVSADDRAGPHGSPYHPPRPTTVDDRHKPSNMGGFLHALGEPQFKPHRAGPPAGSNPKPGAQEAVNRAADLRGIEASNRAAAGAPDAIVAAGRAFQKLQDLHDRQYDALFNKQLEEAAVHAPAGLATIASDVGRDVSAIPRKAVTEATGGHVDLGGQWVPTHSYRLGKQVVEQTQQDIQHPEQNPGNLFLDVSTLLPTGAGAVTRVGRAGEAVGRAGADAGVAAKAAAFGKGLVKKPPRETFPLSRRGVTVEKPLSDNPLLREAQKAIGRARQRRLDNPSRRIGPPSREELVAPKDQGGYGLHPTVAAAADKVLGPQRTAAQLLSRHFGPEATFSRELRAGRNVDRSIAKAPVADLAAAVGHLPGDAPILDRLPAKLRGGLSRGEHKAIQALSIFGDEAVQNPRLVADRAAAAHALRANDVAAAIAEQSAHVQSLEDAARAAEHAGAWDEVARYQHDLAEGRAQLQAMRAELGRHQVNVADFKLAQGPLERLRDGTASDDFMRAAKLTKDLSEQRRDMLIKEGLLDPQGAAWRDAAPAAAYDAVAHGKTAEDALTVEERVLRTVADNPEARVLHGQIEEVDKAIEKLRQRYRTSAKRTRPRTLSEARDEVYRLEAEHEKLVGRFKKAIMSQKIEPEAAAARLAEIEQQIGEHAKARETARAGLEKLNADRLAGVEHGALAAEHGVIQHTGAMAGVTYGAKYPAAVKIAEKAIRKLNAEASRYREAQKTGRLREVLDPSETARRTLARRQGLKVPTLAEELHQEALNSIDEAIARNPEYGPYKRFQEERAQLEQLRGGVEKAHEAEDPIFGHGGKLTAEEKSQLLGTVPVGADEALRHEIGQRLGYRTHLEAALEKAMKGDVPMQTIADETVRRRRELDQVPGAFRTPLSAPPERRPSLTVRAQPGEYGVPLPSPTRRDPSLSHGFQGLEVDHGHLAASPVAGTIDSYLRAVNVVSNLREYGTLWKLSEPARLHDGMVPIRDVAKVSTFLKRARRASDRNLPITQEELKALEGGDVSALQNYLHPADADGARLYSDDHGWDNVPLGWRDPRGEIRWVDARYFDRFAGAKLPDVLHKGADLINNPSRFAMIYARPAYSLNLVSNFGMQAITQGFLAPQMYKRAFSIDEKYGSRAASAMRSGVGEGKARSYMADASLGGRINQGLASFWSHWIDEHSRVSSLLYEMRREGVNLDDREAVNRFLFDDAERARRIRAFRQGNKNMGEFNNLVPIERGILRHLIFVYPWVSRSTIWAGRVLADHPGKSYTLAQVQRITEQHQHEQFGQLPSYLDRAGYEGFTLGGKTYLVGTAPLNALSTAPDVYEQTKGLVSGSNPLESQPSEALSPALTLAFGGLGGASRGGFTGRAQGGALGAASALLRSFPQASALARLGLTHLGPLQIGKNDNPRLAPDQRPVFGERGVVPAVGGFTLGSSFPRAENVEAANAKAEKEQVAALPPADRVRFHSSQTSESWLDQARKAGLYAPGEGWDAGMKRAFDQREKRQLAYADLAGKLGVPTNRLKAADRFRADLELLVKEGIYSQADAAAEVRDAQGLGDAVVNAQRRKLGVYFGDHELSAFRKLMKQAGHPVK